MANLEAYLVVGADLVDAMVHAKRLGVNVDEVRITQVPTAVFDAMPGEDPRTLTYSGGLFRVRYWVIHTHDDIRVTLVWLTATEPHAKSGPMPAPRENRLAPEVSS